MADRPVRTRVPTQRRADAKTLARRYNEGLPRSPSYEFGAGRVRKYQPADRQND